MSTNIPEQTNRENVTFEFQAEFLSGIAKLITEYPDFIKENEDASRQFLAFLIEATEAADKLKLILEDGLNRFHPQVSLTKAGDTVK